MAQPTTEQPPLKYGIVLYPGFQALDVFGTLDILNILSLYQPLELNILAATMDPVSTSVDPARFGQSVVPTHTFDTAPEDLEVVLVPGGLGTRFEENMKPIMEFLRRRVPKLRYFLTVCTGSWIAAKAGVLDGKKATTNKMSWNKVVLDGPNVQWVRNARWTIDGNVWTSSGVTAGIDMGYAFVTHVYGEDMAEKLADIAEYRRTHDSADDPFTRLIDDPRYNFD